MSIIAAGTTTTTALSSTGNTDGTLQLQVNGTTPSVTLNTLGAIGVGSTPAYGTSGQVLVSAGSTAAPAWTTNVSSQWTTTGSNIYYNTGNVGIGTSSVGTKLTVNTASANVGIADFADSAGIGLYAETTSGIPVFGSRGGSQDLRIKAGQNLQLYANSAERFRIGTAGELGIGGATYGTSGQVLTSGGSGAAPTWATAGGGSWTYLSTVTVSNAAFGDVETTLNSTYDMYVIVGNNIISANGQNISMDCRLKVGGSYQTTGYLSIATSVNSAEAQVNLKNTAAIQMFTTSTAYVSSRFSSFVMYVPSPSISQQQRVFGSCTSSSDAGDAYTSTFSGIYTTAGVNTGVRIKFAGNNSWNGNLRLYGIKNS